MSIINLAVEVTGIEPASKVSRTKPYTSSTPTRENCTAASLHESYNYKKTTLLVV